MGIGKWLKNIGKNTAYYPGCLTSYVLVSEAENYRKILGKIGVDFVIVPGVLCCGSPVANAGYEKDARNLARKNLEIFRKHGIKKIITNCPACFKTFSKEYKEMLPDWDIEVEFALKTILEYLRKKKVSMNFKERVTYHDPCHLGRHLGIYQEPREILTRLGYEVAEMKHNKENALCCGGGAGLRVNNPKLADKIAQQRVKEAEEIGVKKIITPCPLCFAHLGENSSLEVMEFSHVVADALGIEVGKTNLKLEKCELKEACS